MAIMTKERRIAAVAATCTPSQRTSSCGEEVMLVSTHCSLFLDRILPYHRRSELHLVVEIRAILRSQLDTILLKSASSTVV